MNIVLGKSDVQMIYSNFSHNPFCPTDVRRDIIERGKKNAMWWQVYGLGKTGQTDGVIFPAVNWVSEMPNDADCKRISYGMDFGYTNDPTTLVKVALYRGELYVQGLLYKTGMKYSDIASHCTKLEVFGTPDYIYCDNDQRAVDTIADFGVYLEPAKKGPNSIVEGIQLIKEYRLNIVSDSDFKSEQLGYKWKEDKLTGKATTVPIDKHNHYFDALTVCYGRHCGRV